MPECNITTGVLDDSKFSQPLPWIGLYIVAGTLVCSLLMAIDTFSSFRDRKFWFPTKYFSLNSTTLTLLAIATKFSVDINTSMPHKLDQLAKLTSSALICTVIANFMPSLGNMQDSDLVSNVLALGIFVITVIVNVGMQMGTGVIYVFLPEHALILFLMLLLLIILCSSALMVTPAKQELGGHYDHLRRFNDVRSKVHSTWSDDQSYTLLAKLMKSVKSHRLVVTPSKQELGEEGYDTDELGSSLNLEYDKIREKVPAGADQSGSIVATLKKTVEDLWLMAYTSSPQFVVGRSVTCHASGALCFVIPVILMEASVKALIMDSVSFCGGTCDYKWSTTLVLYSQLVAVAVGTIAPASRFFFCVSLNRHLPLSRKKLLGCESYWFQKLSNWSDSPLTFQPSCRTIRKSATNIRNCIISVFIKLQTRVVILCKLLHVASVLPVRRSSSSPDMDFEWSLSLDDESWDMHLLMNRSGLEYIEQWIKRGRKKQPTKLVEFIREFSTAKEGFKGVHGFISDDVRSEIKGVDAESEEPPTCWALVVVTLTTIAVALPDIKKSLIDSLLDAVGEGLAYVRLVDENLDDARGSRQTAREAAEQVWHGIDLYSRWFDVDLNKLVLEGKNAKTIITRLAGIGKKWASEIDRGFEPNLAGDCLYRVSTTILKDYDTNFGSKKLKKEFFQWLQTTIADIMGACCTNLPRGFCMERYWDGAIEVREKIIRRQTLLLEGAEEILKIVGAPREDLSKGEQHDIDSWRKKKLTHPLSNPFVPIRYELYNQSLSLPSTSFPDPSFITPNELSLSTGWEDDDVQCAPTYGDVGPSSGAYMIYPYPYQPAGYDSSASYGRSIGDDETSFVDSIFGYPLQYGFGPGPSSYDGGDYET